MVLHHALCSCSVAQNNSVIRAAKGTGFEFDFMMVIWPMCGGEESPEWGHLFSAAYSYRRALRTTCAPYEVGATLQMQQATKGIFFPSGKVE